jgi:DNA-directed RNA polymerase subunit beta
LIVHLSTYARLNDFGIIETPYIKVKNGKITGEVVYLNALEEEKYNIAHAGIPYDENGKIISEKVAARIKTEPGEVLREEVDFIDVAPNQAFSIVTSMIQFLEQTTYTIHSMSCMGFYLLLESTFCVVYSSLLLGKPK